MDKIIANLAKELGYRMGNAPIHIICYADDAVLIADSEEIKFHDVNFFNEKLITILLLYSSLSIPVIIFTLYSIFSNCILTFII